MAKSKLEKLTTVYTPIAVMKYVHLTTPDTRFNDKGDYKVTFVAPQDDPMAIKFIESMQTILDETGYSKAPFKLNDDGEIEWTAKTGFDPKAVDGNGKTIPKSVFIAPGSTGRAKIDVMKYEGMGGGISFRMKGCQVVELSEGGGGFDKVEGGYDSSGAPEVVDDSSLDSNDEEAPF